MESFAPSYDVFLTHAGYSIATIIIGVAFTVARHMGYKSANALLAAVTVGGLLYVFSLGLGPLFGAHLPGGITVPHSISLATVLEYAMLSALAVGVAVACKEQGYWALAVAAVTVSYAIVSTLAYGYTLVK